MDHAPTPGSSDADARIQQLPESQVGTAIADLLSGLARFKPTRKSRRGSLGAEKGIDDGESQRLALAKGLILLLQRAHELVTPAQACKDALARAAHDMVWVWPLLTHKRTELLLASPGAAALVAGVLPTASGPTQSRVLHALADWAEERAGAVDEAAEERAGAVDEAAGCRWRQGLAPFAMAAAQTLQEAANLEGPAAATALACAADALRLDLAALRARKGVGSVLRDRSGARSSSNSPEPAASADTQTQPQSIALSSAIAVTVERFGQASHVARSVRLWGQPGAAQRAQQAQSVLLALAGHAASAGPRSALSAQLPTFIAFHWELAQFRVGLGQGEGAGPCAWSLCTCQAMLGLVAGGQDPLRFVLAPPLLAHTLRLVAEALGARRACRSFSEQSALLGRLWALHGACAQGALAPHLALDPSVRHGGAALIRAYELHDLLASDARPARARAPSGARAPGRLAEKRQRAARAVVEEKPVDLVGLLLDSAAGGWQDGMAPGGFGGVGDADAKTALNAPSDDAAVAAGVLSPDEAPRPTEPLAPAPVQKVVRRQILAERVDDARLCEGSESQRLEAPGAPSNDVASAASALDGLDHSAEDAIEYHPPERIVMRATPGMTETEREALWAAYIADKEAMLGLLGDGRYRDWFDEPAAAPLAALSGAAGVEGALDAAFGGAGGALGGYSVARTPLEASVSAPWQAAAAACLDGLSNLLEAATEPGGDVGKASAEAVSVLTSALSPGSTHVGPLVQRALALQGSHGRQAWSRALQLTRAFPAGAACLALAVAAHDVAARSARRAAVPWVSALTRALRCLLLLARREEEGARATAAISGDAADGIASGDAPSGHAPGSATCRPAAAPPIAKHQSLRELVLSVLVRTMQDAGDRLSGRWLDKQAAAGLLEVHELLLDGPAALGAQETLGSTGNPVSDLARLALRCYGAGSESRAANPDRALDSWRMLVPLAECEGPARDAVLERVLGRAAADLEATRPAGEALAPDAVWALRSQWTLAAAVHGAEVREHPGPRTALALAVVSHALRAAAAAVGAFAASLDAESRQGAESGALRDPRRAPGPDARTPPTPRTWLPGGAAALALSFELAARLTADGPPERGISVSPDAAPSALALVQSANERLERLAAAQGACIELLRGACPADLSDQVAAAMEAAPALDLPAVGSGADEVADADPASPADADPASPADADPASPRQKRPVQLRNPYLLAVVADEGAPRGMAARDLADLDDFIVANPERDYGAFIRAHFPRPTDSDSDESGAEDA